MRRYELVVTTVPVSAIHPHPENAWVGDIEVIKESIEANGIYRPVYVSSASGNILAGNHTYRAVVEMGQEDIDVIYLDGLTLHDERRIMLVDNRSTEKGAHDIDALVPLLHALGGDFAGTGFDQAYLDSVLDDLGGDAVEFDDVKPESWGVMVTCESFEQQQELVARLMEEGLLARGIGTL